MTHPEEMQAVARRLNPARVTATTENLVAALTDSISARQATGEIIGDDPTVVVGVLQTVLLVRMHAERLGGPDRYP